MRQNNSNFIVSWNNIYLNKGLEYHSPLENINDLVNLYTSNKRLKILDVGCGCGKHLEVLAKKGHEVYGIDISNEALNLAKDNFKKKNLDGHFTCQSIYTRLPFEANSFNFIICLRTIHHSNQKDILDLIKEFKRILVSNGMIYITIPKVNLRKKPITKIKKIANRTFLNLEGNEKNVIHFIYNQSILIKHFADFDKKIWVSDDHYYHLLGVLKK